MEWKSWERITFLKKVFLQNEEVCPKMNERIYLYKQTKNLYLNECMLKPKTSYLNKYCSYAILHLCPNSAKTILVKLNFFLQFSISSSPKRNFDLDPPIPT